MASPALQTYLDESRRGLHRLLGQLNRNGFSPAVGSFDRPFWHYRAVTGFESATFAQGVLPLALAYTDPIFGREFIGNPELLLLIESALARWTTLQHEDGSFDEWYPHERSHVATAFTAYGVSETLLLVREVLPAVCVQRTQAALLRAAHWLSIHLDEQVLNHTAGAVPALWNIIALTGDETLREGLERNIALMEMRQSSEGWFPENGGFDAGYLSLSIDYIWKYYEKSRDSRAFVMVEKACDFLEHLVHPDGSSGGEYTARNTKYLIPWGVLAASPHISSAARITARYSEAVVAGRVVRPSTTDDRYFVFFFLHNWMQCARLLSNCGESDFVTAPSLADGIRHFTHAGLVTVTDQTFFLALNYRKSGLYVFFRRDEDGWRPASADRGWFLRDHSGVVYANQFLNSEDAEADVQLDDKGQGAIRLRVPFKKVNYGLPLTSLQIPFLAYAHTLGRIAGVNVLFEKIVKNLFIRKPSSSPYALEREIFVTAERIEIRDRLTGPRGARVELLRDAGSTAPHVPSSRYFVPGDLALPTDRAGVTLPLEKRIVLEFTTP